MGRPFHGQEGFVRLFDRGELRTGDVWHARQGDAIENIAAEIETGTAMEWDRVGIAAVFGAGKNEIVGRRWSGQTGVAFNLLLVPPPGAAGFTWRGGGQRLGIVGGKAENGVTNLLKISGAGSKAAFCLGTAKGDNDHSGQNAKERTHGQHISAGETCRR